MQAWHKQQDVLLLLWAWTAWSIAESLSLTLLLKNDLMSSFMRTTSGATKYIFTPLYMDSRKASERAVRPLARSPTRPILMFSRWPSSRCMVYMSNKACRSCPSSAMPQDELRWAAMHWKGNKCSGAADMAHRGAGTPGRGGGGGGGWGEWGELGLSMRDYEVIKSPHCKRRENQ